ncbi:hypothetical protein MYSE111917_02555 [Mycobacterium senriense]|uniref:Uncharacterized protein n=1 Tax=Mycobacterium senriense TaxID=2775496 RepID=A0ABM7SPW3_9MYCO|nr:hypothetical protein [Mycobacterium senriense]BCZ21780.1 hypothetical protein MTY59_16350 [Mycobacterium senriense]
MGEGGWPFGCDRLPCVASKASTPALIAATEVGRLVVDAIKHDSFFLATHNKVKVRDVVRKRADDVDAFLSAQIAALATP